ncbi:MAG: rod shape-determining protein MreD [Bacteroidaceae bacterium]|nr:rod shape-determining protein MreD [Bacteroidaceae bacterium]
MIVTQLKRLMIMLLLVAFQVLVLNHLQLLGCGIPLIFVAILVYMPMGVLKVGVLLWGFVTGMLIDVFSNTPGVASGAMTFAALVQPSLLKLMAPRDAAEDITPTMQTMGTWNYVRYMMIIFLMHHLVYFSLECFSFYHIADVALLMVTSWVSSVLLALLFESFRKKK